MSSKILQKGETWFDLELKCISTKFPPVFIYLKTQFHNRDCAQRKAII